MELQDTKQSENKKHRVQWTVAIVAVVMLASVAVMLAVVNGLNGTVDELAEESNLETAEAILASADISDKTAVSVPVLYYDQKMDACVDIYDVSLRAALNERQFEWSDCGYYGEGIEAGILMDELDEQYLPIALGGDLLSNRGVKGDNFTRWFNTVEGVSKSYAGTLDLVFNETEASFSYENDDFYPLNEVNFGESESVNKDGNNHLFTMSLGLPFRVLKSGDEEFEITADDDTWVFIGKDLVLDMGGVHDAATGKFKINKLGEVYTSVDGIDFSYSGVKLDGESAIVRVFHADRNSENSVLKLKFTNTVLNITNTSLAKRDGGVEVAYDPTDPSYVAPLGESLVVRPDNTHSLVVMITVQVVAVGAFGMLIAMATSVAWRYWRRDHSQEE